MRVCGMGDHALHLVAARVLKRTAFGGTLAKSPLVQAQLAEAWLKLHCAWYGACPLLSVRLTDAAQGT